MKKIIAIVFSLFLISGLFAEWKEVKIPANAVHTLQATKNENCEVIERKFDEYNIHEIIVAFDDGFFVSFEYSEELWNTIKENDTLDWISVSKLAEEYNGTLEKVKQEEI